MPNNIVLSSLTTPPQTATDPFVSTVPAERDGTRVVATFNPMVAEDFSTQTLGQNYTTSGTWKADHCPIDDTHVFSGTKSMKIIAETYDGVTCGGTQDSYFGGRSDLPAPAFPGDTIWYKLRVYFPSEFSWGYVYQNNNTQDETDASGCGLSNDSDGSLYLKFMRLTPDSGSRNYFMLPVHRRDMSIPQRTETCSLAPEPASVLSEFTTEAARIVPDTWMNFQFAIHVSKTGTGWCRAWIEDTFIGEVTNINTINETANNIDEWAIGTHFNGGHYSPDGTASHKEFWVDDVIVASTVDGYGAPTTTDSGGRAYIDPTLSAGDFS